MAEDSLPKTRAAAMAIGAKYYFTGKPCIRGHVMKRMTKGGCVGCLDEQAAGRAARRRAEFDTDGEYYFTGVPCKNGHVDKRRVRDGRCLACHREHETARYKANPEYRIAYGKEYAKRRPDIRAKAVRAWKERTNADPERRAAFLEKCARQRIKDADKRRVYNAEYNRLNAERFSERFKAYYRANRDRYHAHTRKRQAKQMQRTPAWLTADDFDAMTAMYAEANRMSLETGIPHEVDHIIPLQGRTVSGLHVPLNLRIVTRFENRSKANKYAD